MSSLTVDQVMSVAVAIVLLIGAIGNRTFYFARMGGGPSDKRMPTWLARLILIAGAIFFMWLAFIK